MQELNMLEIEEVGAGDAAATRPPGTNSWGEYVSIVGEQWQRWY